MPDEGYIPPIVATLRAEAGDFFATVAAAKRALSDFANTRTAARIGVESGEAQTTIAAVKSELVNLARQVTKAKLGADAGEFWREIEALKVKVSGMDVDLAVDADVSGVLDRIAQMRTDLEISKTSIPVKVEVETNAAVAAASAVQVLTLMRAFGNSPVEIPIGWEDLSFQEKFAEILAIKAEAAKAVHIPVDVESGGGAGGAIGGIAAAAAAAGGGGGAAGAAAAGANPVRWLANTFLVMHALHLFMPEIIGLTVALSSVAIGFTVLGAAAGDSVNFITQGYGAVNKAQDAMLLGIPGTQQYSKAVGQLGESWANIETVFQPAVKALNDFFLASTHSPQTAQVEGFVNAQVMTLTKMASQGMGAFQPVILATERAIQTVEGMIQKSIGGGGLARAMQTLSNMIGPALVQLVQLGGAIVRIGTGFATAIQSGEGLEFLVQLFRTIGDLVNSSFGQGFVKGWVDFDRFVTALAGDVVHFMGVLSGLGANLKDVGEIVGGVVSAFVGVKSFLAVAGFLGTAFGASWGKSMTGAARDTGGLLSKVAGPAGVAVGIVGVTSAVSQMIGVSNPLSGLLHNVAAGFGLVSNQGNGAIDSVSGVKGQLHGAVIGTEELTAAQDLLARSMQSIGGSLGGMGSGLEFSVKALTNIGNRSKTTTNDVRRFYDQSVAGGQSVSDALASVAQNFNMSASSVQDVYNNAISAGQKAGAALTTTFGYVAQQTTSQAESVAQAFADMVTKATDSVDELTSYLSEKGNYIATWAADAVVAIQKGINPTLVADIAQSSPQDLHSLSQATGSASDPTSGVGGLNVSAATMQLFTKLASQAPTQTFGAGLTSAYASSDPIMKQAAANLLTAMGSELNIAFTNTPSSANAIGNAFGATVPPGVLATLAGQLHTMTPAGVNTINGQPVPAAAPPAAQNPFGGLLTSIGLAVAGFAGAAKSLSHGGDTVAGAALSSKASLSGAAADLVGSAEALTGAARVIAVSGGIPIPGGGRGKPGGGLPPILGPGSESLPGTLEADAGKAGAAGIFARVFGGVKGLGSKQFFAGGALGKGIGGATLGGALAGLLAADLIGSVLTSEYGPVTNTPTGPTGNYGARYGHTLTPSGLRGGTAAALRNASGSRHSRAVEASASGLGARGSEWQPLEALGIGTGRAGMAAAVRGLANHAATMVRGTGYHATARLGDMGHLQGIQAHLQGIAKKGGTAGAEAQNQANLITIAIANALSKKGGVKKADDQVKNDYAAAVLEAAKAQKEAGKGHVKAAKDLEKAATDHIANAKALQGAVAAHLASAKDVHTAATNLDKVATGHLHSGAETLDKAAKQWAEATAKRNILEIQINSQAQGTIAAGTAGYTAAVVAGKRALGGPVAGGLGYLINERGTEVFVPHMSGTVVPAGSGSSSAASSSGSSMTTTYHIDQLVIVAQNPAQLEQQLASRARFGALSARPSPASNLGVGV